MKKNYPIENFEEAAEMLKAVAHPLRLRILVALCEEEHHVNELAQRLDMPQSIISQQLRILRMKSLVAATRENGYAYYQITQPHLRDLLECLADCQSQPGARKK